MTNDQEVSATDLVFEAARYLDLDKDGLWQPLLDLNDLLHEIVAIWVELLVDLEGGLLDLFRA